MTRSNSIPSDLEPYIPSSQALPEITLKVIGLSIVLTIILALSNAYLALKIGILASASIPAAILSMGILRLFKQANILENNLVQTAASAGEAVAGGVAYTAPALIMIHYWAHFDYWPTCALALLSGLLGVLFSVPLRRVLVTQPELHFPEGRAIAEVLIVGSEKGIGLREMIQGSLLGALLEFAQAGLHLLASQAQWWFARGGTVFGLGLGFSPTLLGVGYLIGFDVALSLMLGATVGWLLGIPVVSHLLAKGAFVVPGLPDLASATLLSDWVAQLWSERLRYLGIGAMLVAGVWTMTAIFRPFMASMATAAQAWRTNRRDPLHSMPRVEQDLPLPIMLLGSLVLLVAIAGLFYFIFPLDLLHWPSSTWLPLILACVAYIAIIGFISCAITGYFSGLVGVTATPGSAIIIAGLVIAAIGLRMVDKHLGLSLTAHPNIGLAAIAVILGAVITGAAAIANDNIQDLKVGHLVGATPWKQQLMLMLGVCIAAFTIPWAMDVLFKVYGIGDVFPQPGMDPHFVLPAPPAAMMAAVTQGVFNYQLPWSWVGVGALLIIGLVLLQLGIRPLRRHLSILGFASGVYLPLSTTLPLFLGGLVAFLAKRRLCQNQLTHEEMQHQTHLGVLTACGLVAGAAVMSVLLAIPFMIAQDPEVLRLLPSEYAQLANWGSGVVSCLLLIWVYRKVTCIKAC